MRIDLTLVGPDGTARDVAVLARAGTRWRDVRGSFGGGQLWNGDRPVTDADVPGRDNLRDGAVLHMRRPVEAAAAPSGHHLDVVGGPDSGRSVPLGRVPVTVGRSRQCTLVLSDPRASRMHAEVALGVRGATVRDLGSAGGTWIDGAPAALAASPVPAAAYLRVGDTYLQVTGPGTGAATEIGADDPTELELPQPPEPTAATRLQWAATALPAVLGVGLALAMHSVQFLLFALLSPLALVGSAVADRLHRGRVRRRSRRDYRRELARMQHELARLLPQEVRARRSTGPDPASVLRAACRAGPRSEGTRGRTAGLLTVRLGLADLPSRLLVDDCGRRRPAGIAGAVPAYVDLARGALGIAGPRALARGLARWVIGQLAARASPAELGLRVLLSTGVEAEWRWLRWLPHLDVPAAITPDEHAELVRELAALRDVRSAQARGEPWTGRRLVLLLDGLGAGEVMGLDDLLRSGEQLGITAVAVGTDSARLPVACTSTAVAIGDTGSTFEARTPDDGTVPLVADRVDTAWCDRLSRALAALRAERGDAKALPASCSLLELLGLTEPAASLVAARWRDSHRTLSTVLGTAADGPVSLDLVRDGPHALIAGTTGSGKSELLRTLVAGLAANHPPDEVGFVLIDYKGGAAFAECTELPHTLGVVTDLDGHLAARALQSLECELRRRERLFADVGARDFAGYRACAPSEVLSRLVIVADEFAELATELPEFVTGLVAVARRGRSLGVHLVLATQRPAGVVSAEIRANTAVRIALRVTDGTDSQDVIDTVDAAAIDRRHPGRAYLRLPGSGPVMLQTALADEAAATNGDRQPRVIELDAWRRPVAVASEQRAATALHQLVDATREAALLEGRASPVSPWLPPLPAVVAADSLAAADQDAVPLGLLDLPREQRRLAFTVDVAAGGTLLFAGGPGSGRTEALRTLAVSAAERMPPHRLQLQVIDHAGGGLAGLAALPHCASLAVEDIATTTRLLDRLADEVRRRRAAGPTSANGPALLVLLDGWEQFLAAAEQQAGAGVVETLLGLLRSGPTVGLTLALAGDRGALASRLSSAVATKLALRLTDTADYALLGLSERSVPTQLPPGRAVRAADGAELQLAHLGDEPTRQAADAAITRIAARWAGSVPTLGPAAIRVRPLPGAVRLAALRRPAHSGAADRIAPVVLGVGGDDGEPLVADLFAGRARLLVAGPPGSGRSTLLLTLLSQLVELGPRLLVAAPGASPLTARARAAGAAVLAPDDDLPAVPDGRSILLLDDAEAFLDSPVGDALTAWALRRPDAAVVLAGCSDELALTFRGIAAHVRKARCAVLLDPGPGDGALAGVRLSARRSNGPPGRGVVIGDPSWGAPFGAAPLPIQVAQP